MITDVPAGGGVRRRRRPHRPAHVRRPARVLGLVLAVLALTAVAAPVPAAYSAPSSLPAPAASAVSTAPLRSPAPAAEVPGDPATELDRSLIYSGLLALAISAAGLTMVGWRRRQW